MNLGARLATEIERVKALRQEYVSASGSYQGASGFAVSVNLSPAIALIDQALMRAENAMTTVAILKACEELSGFRS
jgi:hypothetical protein